MDTDRTMKAIQLTRWESPPELTEIPFSRRAGTWRIEHRIVVLGWRKTEVWPDSASAVPSEGFVRGARHPEDPSYEAALRAGAAPR